MVNRTVKGQVKKAAHKPPARIRYEQSHPIVSCRLSKDEYDLLKQRLDDLGGVSFADFVRDSLGLLELRVPETSEIKVRARMAGYEQGKAEHQIWYRCAVCGQRIDVKPNSEPHKAMIDLMKGAGWGHSRCHQER